MNGLPNGNVEDQSGQEGSGGSGTKGMYSVKRPYDIPKDVQLPDCMYQVQPISSQASVSGSSHDLTGSTSRGTLTESNNAAAGVRKPPISNDPVQQKASSTSMDVIDSLELRQLNIIDKLSSLKEMITTIHEKCVGAGSTTSIGEEALTETTDQQVMTEENIDIVIKANPKKPPYSLIFFARLLENNYTNAVVNITSHVHSSYRGNINRQLLKTFHKEGALFANVNFTIVWKDVNATTMIIAPVQSTSIEMESNIARFLSRLLPLVQSSLNYDCLSWDALVKVDRFLDQANDSKVATLIDNELKKSKQSFLSGAVPTVADLVLYSSVLSKTEGLNLSPNVLKWMKRIEASFGVWILGVSG